MLIRLTLVLLAVQITAAPLAGQQPRDEVVRALSSMSYWNLDGRKDARAWSEDELVRIQQLAGASDDPILRLRASKIVVDAAGRSRFRANQEDVALAAFRYLESHLDAPEVRDLCVGLGFTHYGVEVKEDGSTRFHIERATLIASGGLNLRWDRTKKEFTELESWGFSITQ